MELSCCPYTVSGVDFDVTNMALTMVTFDLVQLLIIMSPVIPFKAISLFYSEIDSLIRVCWIEERSCHDIGSGESTQDQVSGVDLREDHSAARLHRELRCANKGLTFLNYESASPLYLCCSA